MLKASRRVHSSRRGLRWEPWEEATLHAPRWDAEIAAFLGRSVLAVQSKRVRLNRESYHEHYDKVQLGVIGCCQTCRKRDTDECPHPNLAVKHGGNCSEWLNVNNDGYSEKGS